jgi:hypothetical protein
MSQRLSFNSDDPSISLLHRVVMTHLSEVLYGPGADAYFLNPGDRGLIASLDTLSADTASAQPGGRSSVAAHVEHLRYGLSLLNRFARGEDPWGDANWAESWTRQQVTDEQWKTLRSELAREARAWMEAMKRPPAWDEPGLASAVGSIPHLAYHLGAIRQLAQAASGPSAVA